MKDFKYMVIDETGVVYAVSNDLLEIQDWLLKHSIICGSHEEGFEFLKLDYSGKYIVVE